MSCEETNVAITTRSMWEDLRELSWSHIDLPYRRIPFEDKNGAEYVRELVKLDSEWTVNIDEDAFLFRGESVKGLIALMDREGYACCGVPDGGMVGTRKHNPVVPNAFFNIINTRKARGVESQFEEWMKEMGPKILRGEEGKDFEYDMFEIYYPFFLGMVKRGERILYLDAETWRGDGMSTIVKDHEGVPFLIHSWKARDWKNKEARERIERVSTYAFKEKS